MNKKTAIATAACAALMALALGGCGSEPEEPRLPSDSTALSSTSYTLTDPEKLKALALGETAVWNGYEVTISSVDRADGKLMAQVSVKAHMAEQKIAPACLLSLGMPPESSTFGDVIHVPAYETVSGTLAFDDRCGSQRLFWNDGATEATWDLTLPAVRQPEEPKGEEPEPDPAKADEPAKAEEPKQDEAAEAQKRAVAALEAELPSLFANNTLYTFRGVDTSTATVTPREGGGYEYVNDVAILGADGVTASTANVRLICEPSGNCTSMAVDGAFLF